MLAVPIIGLTSLDQLELLLRADFSIKLPASCGGYERYTVFVRKGAIDFLKTAAKSHELVLFTAARRAYADAIVDALEIG